MSEFDSERAKPWNIYTGSQPNPSQAGVDRQAPWRNFGTSMNAISFGFVATAILISMFLIMAIFEHLFRPNASFTSLEDGVNRPATESRRMQKLGHQPMVPTTYASDFSVVMPGQRCPTYIAQPAPLPCKREGASWPSHEHTYSLHRL
ncbi:hypothetical protein DCAR_0207509 [Daucus carota subsp. sativus]|uniref:Uncharacterized protein n=1 Tax=Daucus carota subsp. sativus TaxID=79200 RepID=A0AAF1AM49_DAUCS|nr:PREDICTED: uncharacterized protein LOC108209317 [Daucus carota subsp. sativus]WOG88274.1 hypothetical protein DCAR_0207509 [Daucus carota subsp. sativus]